MAKSDLLDSNKYERVTEPKKTVENIIPEKSKKTEPNFETPDIKNLSQLKKALQVGMEFEILDHLRPECIGEHRRITSINTVGFTSKKLDENGEPSGEDIHMDWEKAENWKFENDTITFTFGENQTLMSFRLTNDMEHSIETQHEPFTEEITGADKNIKYQISETSDEQHKYNVQILTSTDGENFSYSGNGRFCETLDDARNFVNQDIAERQETKQIAELREKFSDYYSELYDNGDSLPDYDKALKAGEKYIQTHPDFVQKFNETRGDILSSDREVASFGFALADAGLIRKFSEPEKSEPEVKLQSIVIDLTAPRDEIAKIPDEPKKAFHITDDSLGEGGQKSKFQANILAIQTLKTLEKENRPATDEEKEILSKYVGWGGIAQAFDENNPAWVNEYQELKSLLTPQEYSSARASTLDAFYTTPTVINAIYEALENFGFEGGNVLEPAMGVGNFFGCMPEEMRKDSKLYGVEIDSISGRIAQKIYPDADIAIEGFENNHFQNGCFDVAVGNVPFGDLGFKDEIHHTTKLHDYFFAETVDKVKEGGIIAFVTSAGTLDKLDETARKALSDKADLIGAIRLPGGKNGAFKDNANTEVTTDIIFLQKHSNKPLFLETKYPDWVHIGQTENGLPINKYFEQNPDMVLGKVVEGNKLYGSGTMVVADDGADLKTQLHEAVSKLSAKIDDERGRDVYAKTDHGLVEVPSNLRNYSFFEYENNIYFKQNGDACEFRFDKTNSQHKRFKAFIALRDTTRELLTAQEFDKPDSVIKELQRKLNRLYDDFYKKYGLIHSVTNKRYFGEDVSYNLVAGLEKKFDKTKLIEKSDSLSKKSLLCS